MRRLILIVLLFCVVSAAFSQQFRYSLWNYKAVDGLPQSQVNVMLEDMNGYLWIGTHGGGLARFDGLEFKVFTTIDGLQNNIVTYLKLDSKQNLWIIHPRGITKYDGVSFKKFQQDGAPSNTKRVRRAFEVRDSLFIITAPGNLGKIYKDSVYYWSKPLGDNDMVNYCHLVPNKDILIYANDSSFILRSQTGNDFRLSHKGVFNRLFLMFNYRGKPWMKTDSGYFSLDLQKRKFQRASLPIENPIMYYDHINDVFWTRAGTALMREKISGGKVEIDTVLHDNDISQVFVDQEGNTWFATMGDGLYKYFIQDFDRCSSENMRSIMAICKDRSGAMWIGSSMKGLWKIKKGKVTSYVDPKEPYRNYINCIKEGPDGTLWVGSTYGLGKYNPAEDNFSWLTRDDGLSYSSVVNIEFDDSGNLWLGTYGGGMNYYDGKKFTVFGVRDGLSTNVIMSTHYSSRYKKLFIGSEFGVSVLDAAKTVSQLSIPGIENTSILSIQPYRDSLLLIGTGGSGFVIYNPASRFVKHISTHQGLSSDFTYFVAADHKNYIWVGSEKGINRIRLDRFFDVSESLHYDYDNGLTGVETNQNAFYLGKNEKFFGLIDGIYSFNEIPRAGRTSFDLHLTDIDILYGQFSARNYSDSLTGFYKIPYKPQLPPDKNHITFHFNRVDKRYPKSVKFKYFLENFDKRWSQPSSSREVTYSNLPPGDYMFRVMSTNNQGGWTDAQIAYPFTVKAPFYQTAAFIVGMFVLLSGMIIIALYLRVKQKVNKVMETERIRVREQEALRKEIARDFHDEMGNQLTRIINYISLLKLNANGNADGNGHVNGNGHSNGHHDLYTKVENSAKYLYTGTRDFIWSIDPVNDELSKLFIHIRDFGEKLFEEKSISFRAFNAVREKVKLPYGFSREANLIFKEAMTNAFKYSQAKNITLSLERAVDDSFEIALIDDGVGFFTGDMEKSNGLKNIRERADRVNAVVRISSVKNHGTKIVLSFKITKTLKYGLAL